MSKSQHEKLRLEIRRRVPEATDDQIDRVLGSLPDLPTGTIMDRLLEFNRGGWYAFRVDASKQLLAYNTVRRMHYSAYCPMRVEYRFRNHISEKKARVKYPLIAGYIFIRMPPRKLGLFFRVKPDCIWRVLARDGEPYCIPDDGFFEMVEKYGGGKHIAPTEYRYMLTHHEFDVGDAVEILSGAFAETYAGREIVVQEIRGSKALTELEIFNSIVEVEIPLQNLGKAS